MIYFRFHATTKRMALEPMFGRSSAQEVVSHPLEHTLMHSSGQCAESSLSRKLPSKFVSTYFFESYLLYKY